MPKNIVVLCDGTSNEISSNRTNVLRLYGCLQKDESQIVFYDPGVGTFGADNAWSQTYRKFTELWGQATGWGLDRNVKESYRFIVENYEKGPKIDGRHPHRDQIYIFGFSRGAYTARVLAGFIHCVGLMNKENLNLLDYAYRAYKSIGKNEGKGHDSDVFAEVRLYERILQTDRPTIRCLGLFDTVASVIEPGRLLPRLSSNAFTSTNSSVQTVRHAVAINEERTMFQPTLWPEGGEYRPNLFDKDSAVPQDSKEVWFTGVHGDIGGGYPEDQGALAKLPLAWMLDEIKSTGLKLKPRTINRIVLGQGDDNKYSKPDPKGRLHNSMTTAWSILEFIPRRLPRGGIANRSGFLGVYLPLFSPRPIPDGAKLHKSVEERGTPYPKNLPGHFEFVE
ncbi:MAG: DUF2235 domain-containing protein [Pseudomonadota bacterium]